MKLATFIVCGKQENKISVVIILEKGMSGETKEQLLKPDELLEKIEKIVDQEYTIVSNEPLILELSLLDKTTRNEFTKWRLATVENILNWWGELDGK